MIPVQMQRSHSSPTRPRAISQGFPHSSRPAPATTHVSRPHTPPPELRVDSARNRTLLSRSPVARCSDPPSPTPLTNQTASRRPIITQTVAPPSAAMNPPISSSPPLSTPSPPVRPPAPSPETPRRGTSTSPDSSEMTSPGLAKALLPDPSLYANPAFPPESDSTTLEELAHVVRLSKYQERKRASTRVHLQRNLISNALSARLMRSGEMAHRNLAQSFRLGDKKAFAPLYEGIHNVRRSCDELRRYALLEPEMDSLADGLDPSQSSPDGLPNSSNTTGRGVPASVAPFLHEISADTRDTFLSFLTQIRTNPDFLATRLCALSNAERTSLTTFFRTLEPSESVLPSSNSAKLPKRDRALGRGAVPDRGGLVPRSTAAQSPSTIGRLLSFQRHDPLSALIFTCFANSAGPDSQEDRRRTDVWATACARLLTQSSSGLEPMFVAVLDVWTSMRDWSGKTNMEWYLMKILEDGAFLLDRAEDQHGTRFNLSDWSKLDDDRSERFYEGAVEGLFALLDDEDATGIPDGFLELGNEILRKLEGDLVVETRRRLVTNWLFQHFLPGIIIHPEAYGLMSDFHITLYGREKILRQVVIKAIRLVGDATSPMPTSAVPPNIRTHVDNIMNRLSNAPASRRTAPRLLPARSITSLRETVEVHPYLVISPADLLTLVNALFPERAHSRASSSMQSRAASVSGFSAISQQLSLGQHHARGPFDTASITSQSASSVFSDGTTSREPLIDNPGGSRTPLRYSPPMAQDAAAAAAAAQQLRYEDDGYRLRLALHDMTLTLGLDVVSGSCHPCAETWAVLFVSGDGSKLSTQMTYDPDDETDEVDTSSVTTDTEDEDDTGTGPELDKDYHQLRDSILRLVEEFEIPRSLQPDSSRTQLSNRASGIKKYRSKTEIISPERSMGSRNPYRVRRYEEATEHGGANLQGSPLKQPRRAGGGSATDPPPVLIAMLTAASSQSRAQSDFVSAHLYWQTLQQLGAITSSTLRENGFAALLNIFSRGPRDSIRRSAAAIEGYDAWLVSLKQSQERHEGLIDSMTRRMRALRDKMWFVTDVQHSAAYEHCRSIAVALKTMGLPRRRRQGPGGTARNPIAYLFRSESQIMELVAASDEQGGPNKLSDDQAENTRLWLEGSGILFRFCQGEERIHRFCLEINSLIGKLIGESIIEGPVLWSSELYSRDRQIFEGVKGSFRLQDRDSFRPGSPDDSSSVLSDLDRRFASSPLRPGSASLRDARSLSGPHSFDTASRYSISRSSMGFPDILDGQDYFGVASPVHNFDPTATLWSPFFAASTASSATSRAQSPTASLTSISSTFSQAHHQFLPSQTSPSTGRPGTSASSNETVFQQRTPEEKVRFLGDLRQTLLTLLLSDLGNLVYAQGSETDIWFNKLGQECIERRDALDRRERREAAAAAKAKKATNIALTRPHGLEKKKSSENLRDSGASSPDTENTQTPVEDAREADDGVAVSARGRENSGDGGALLDGRGSNRESKSKKMPPATPLSATEFPFDKAFRRLLNMFSVHPNPYAKLNALHELKHLIDAYLTSSTRRARSGRSRSDKMSSGGGNGDLGKQRRVLSSSQGQGGWTGDAVESRFLGPTGNRVPSSSTDMITAIFRSLFRDPLTRPRALFRDLQFVASFVPPSTLDRSGREKTFFESGLAALSLKEDVCRTMVEVADEVIASFTPSKARGVGLGLDAVDAVDKTSRQPSMSPPPPAASYTLRDAGRMCTIAAKEGFPAAQRELGLFYLSHPELIERMTMPLSKPREVFNQTLMEKYGGPPRASATSRFPSERSRGVTGVVGSGGGSGTGSSGGSGSQHSGSDNGSKEGDVRDPALMCVAIHWMAVAKAGGDEIATIFLQQHE